MSQNKYFLVKTHPFYVLLLGKERAKIIGNKWIVSIFLFVVFGLCSFCSSLTSAPFVGRLTTVATEKYNKLFSIWRLQYTFSTNIIGKYWKILKNITNCLPSEYYNWRNSQSFLSGDYNTLSKPMFNWILNYTFFPENRIIGWKCTK